MRLVIFLIFQLFFMSALAQNSSIKIPSAVIVKDCFTMCDSLKVCVLNNDTLYTGVLLKMYVGMGSKDSGMSVYYNGYGQIIYSPDRVYKGGCFPQPVKSSKTLAFERKMKVVGIVEKNNNLMIPNEVIKVTNWKEDEVIKITVLNKDTLYSYMSIPKYYSGSDSGRLIYYKKDGTLKYKPSYSKTNLGYGNVYYDCPQPNATILKYERKMDVIAIFRNKKIVPEKNK
jgi:hypothetical protein